MSSQGSGTIRPERAKRYKPFPLIEGQSYAEHINALGMVCSLLGLLMRMKIASWVGVYCSVVYLANSGAGGDMKQTLSLIMLSMSSLVMVYMQNPSPLNLNY